jgi:hypothetical protein
MGELIDIGLGVRLACDDVGSGRPVLLIHGVSMHAASSSATWTPSRSGSGW